MINTQSFSAFEASFYDAETDTYTKVCQSYENETITWKHLLSDFLRLLRGAGYYPTDLEAFNADLEFETYDLPSEEKQAA
jgi:hypothetical protein